MAVKFTNNAKTTLASSITDVATTATVTDGSVFPTLGAGEYFYCTFDDTTNNEIVKVTARSGNTLTIVRGVDNTTARAFSSGDAAELRATAGLLTDIQENIAAKSANQTVYNTTTASSATDYDIGIDPSVEANAMVFLNGVMQHHDTFSFSGSTLTFDTAPSDGMALEVIVDNLINLQSSNLTVDTFTAADVGGSPQTDFTLSDSPAAETNLIVFVDGVFQDQDAYTISSNVLTMTDGVVADRVVTVYVINPVNIGTPSDGTVTSAKLSGNITMPANLTVTGDVAFDSPTFVVDNANSRVGIGTAAPTTLLDIVGDVKMSAGLQVSGIDYPTSDGTNGQVLTTDGAGTLSFSTISGYTDSDVETYLDGGTSTPTFSTATVTGDLTVDTNTLYVDSTNNYVGIGTASPAYVLDVSGSASQGLRLNGTGTGGSWMAFSNSGTIYGYISSAYHVFTGGSVSDFGIRGENNLVFGIGTAERLRIDSSGNVGIGTSSPSKKLSIKTDSAASVVESLRLENNAAIAAGKGLQIGFGLSDTEGATNRAYIESALLASGSYMAFATNDGATGTYERLRIDQSGNVGINQTAPTQKLEVVGKIVASEGITTFAGDPTNYGLFRSGTTMQLKGAAAMQIESGSGSNIQFFTNGANERMRILSSGGITFNGDTSTSNALDDYEEGTFTPSTTGLTGVTLQHCGYTKVGRLVTVDMRLTWTGSDNQSSQGLAIGMPFVGINPSGANTAGTGLVFYNGTQLFSGAAVSGHVANGASTIAFYRTSGGTFTSITRNLINGSYDWIITYSYFAA